jgi:aldehyde:ferredoxin oxidoreductase
MPTVFRINLKSKKITPDEITPSHRYEYFAGRALSSKIVAEEVDPVSDPLGPSNKLVFSLGFLAGTSAPNSGRMSIGSKSPLTHGIKESNVGGKGPAMLAMYGIRALVFEDVSPQLIVVRISSPKQSATEASKVGVFQNDKVRIEILDGTPYTNMNNYELTNSLISTYGSKVGAFMVGSAGEKCFLSASIASIDMEGYPSRHAGRGGMGTVMGSKRIKAIIIEPAEHKIEEIHDKSKFIAIAKPWFKEKFDSSRVFSKFGTNVGLSMMSESHGLPTHNFRKGSYKDQDKINADALNAFIVKNDGKFGVGCSPGCSVQCSNILYNQNHEHITSGLEFETIGMNGSNILINDIEKIAWIDHYTDDVGLDSIETGNMFAVLMEAGKLQWGDADTAINLLKGIQTNVPESNYLSKGCFLLAKELGVTRVAQVKGQGFPAYDPRSFKAMGVTLATSPMGADHTAGPAIMSRKAYASKEYKANSPHDPDYKVLLSQELQLFIMMLDSSGLCYFMGPSYEVIKDRVVPLFNARYGWNKDIDFWMQWMKDCLQLELDFNKKAGFTTKDDTLPDFLLTEKQEEIDRGWDIPKNEISEFWKQI